MHSSRGADKTCSVRGLFSTPLPSPPLRSAPQESAGEPFAVCLRCHSASAPEPPDATQTAPPVCRLRGPRGTSCGGSVRGRAPQPHLHLTVAGGKRREPRQEVRLFTVRRRFDSSVHRSSHFRPVVFFSFLKMQSSYSLLELRVVR